MFTGMDIGRWGRKNNFFYVIKKETASHTRRQFFLFKTLLELINKYKKIADEYEEKARILLRENMDLKAVINEHGIEISGGL